MNIDVELDVCGMSCPMPLLKAKQALNGMQSGEVLKVLATDPGSVRDFQSYADLSGHEFLVSNVVNDVYTHVLKKR